MTVTFSHNIITAEDAVSGLSRIFGDLQANPNTHDDWDWMDAEMYLDTIRDYLGIEQPWVAIPFNGPTHPDGDSTDLGGD